MCVEGDVSEACGGKGGSGRVSGGRGYTCKWEGVGEGVGEGRMV